MLRIMPRLKFHVPITPFWNVGKCFMHFCVLIAFPDLMLVCVCACVCVCVCVRVRVRVRVRV